jgi:iron(III) transport system ATP-binding protein
MNTSTQTSSSDAPPFLDVQHITRQFGAFTALDDVSVSVRTGEFVSILGPSGCGKTTLLRIIAGLERPNQGEIWIRDRNVTREPVASRDLGIVFQSYALFPNISVIGNVQYGLNERSSSARRSRAMEMLDLVGLADQAAKYPAQLSGGQQQRVALARALAPNPSLLLLDEPLSALDARVRVRLRAEIRQIQRKLGVTTIMVTHDQEEALTMADRIVVLDAGRLMQFSEPDHLYSQPANPFVAGFIGAMNFLPGCRRTGKATARFLDYTLSITEGGRLPPAGDPVTLAIRPEHLRIGDSQDTVENRIKAQVHDIEFRGSVSRVMLRVRHANGEPSAVSLEMDLQPKAVEQLKLDKAHIIDILLPPKHLLAFASDAKSAATAMENAYAA